MCFPLDFVCLAKAAGGSVASKVTNSFLDEVRKSAADATTTILKTLGTFWWLFAVRGEGVALR